MLFFFLVKKIYFYLTLFDLSFSCSNVLNLIDAFGKRSPDQYTGLVSG